MTMICPTCGSRVRTGVFEEGMRSYSSLLLQLIRLLAEIEGAAESSEFVRATAREARAIVSASLVRAAVQDPALK